MTKGREDGTSRRARLRLRVQMMTGAISLAALGCLTMVLYWVDVKHTINNMERSIGTVRSASMVLYHTSVSARDTGQSTGAHGLDPGGHAALVEGLLDRMRVSAEALQAMFADDQPPPKIWNDPAGFAAWHFDSRRVPDNIRSIWQFAPGEPAIGDLMAEQLLICEHVCLETGGDPAFRAAAFERIGTIAIGILPSRLNALTDAGATWAEETTRLAVMTTTGAFLLIMVSVVVVRNRLIDPLIDETYKAAMRVQMQNYELEKRVVERTSDLSMALHDAREAVAARSEFLANMSHEIRTPMNGVLGVAALLQRTSLTEQQRNLVDTIVQSGQVLLRVINDVLETASATAGKMEIEPRPTSLREVVQDVAALHAPSAAGKGLAFAIETGNAEATRSAVMIDPDRLSQVLSNLMGNAVKFTTYGGITVTLEEVEDDGRIQARVTIADSGGGISESDQIRIFEPFEQVRGSHRTGGTGLGLALCRALTEQMGGQISVDSRLGEGSAFHLTFDLAIVSAEMLALDPPEMRSAV